ncbi:MAG: GFA family protein [Rhodospirillales bacterium]|nr:GFA family protein [Rhodospirillales bacterium]MBO6788299.1 GFA family protein [Rhodospirillales bacterium]
MATTHEGACLCGAVSFEIEGDFERFFLCHCKRCRKGTGSAHASNLFSSTATLTWNNGENKIRTYQIPGARHSKSFCTECGGALPRQSADGTMVIVPAGSLDTPVELRPVGHIYCADRADWDDCLHELPEFERLPE